MTPSAVLRRLALFWFLVALPQAGAAAKDARISDLLVSQEGSSLLVSFQLLDGLTDTLVERIESGLPTGFSYRVDVERPRRWWLNKTVVDSTLQVVAMYNAITREYLINYKHDGKLIESRVVKTLDALEREMTIVHEMPFVDLEEDPDARLTLRLRAELGSRTILGFIPATIRTDSAISRRRTAVWETVRSE